MYNVDYYFGSTENTYDKVLDGLYTTEVHSFKTSSLPLAEFWKPENFLKLLEWTMHYKLMDHLMVVCCI